MMLQDLLYIIAGSLTGLLSGLLGIGGGIIVVPALLFIFEMTPAIPNALAMHIAAGSSLAIMLFTSLTVALVHHRIHPILWWVYQRLSIGLVLGTIFGATLAVHLSTTLLRFFFACFLVFVAFKMLPREEVSSQEETTFPPIWQNRMVSFMIGLNSGMLGVGGGVLIIPYLTYCGVDPRRIAPISSLCTMTVALIGTLTFILSSQSPLSTVHTTGYIYWPAVCWVAISSMVFAPIGARLAYRLPLSMIRYLFIIILLLTAMGLIL